MERLEIALNAFLQSMEVEGLTPRQQRIIYDQVAALIQIAHSEAWESASKTALDFVRERLKPA